jgi:hypothetical protein
VCKSVRWDETKKDRVARLMRMIEESEKATAKCRNYMAAPKEAQTADQGS